MQNTIDRGLLGVFLGEEHARSLSSSGSWILSLSPQNQSGLTTWRRALSNITCRVEPGRAKLIGATKTIPRYYAGLQFVILILDRIPHPVRCSTTFTIRRVGTSLTLWVLHSTVYSVQYSQLWYSRENGQKKSCLPHQYEQLLSKTFFSKVEGSGHRSDEKRHDLWHNPCPWWSYLLSVLLLDSSNIRVRKRKKYWQIPLDSFTQNQSRYSLVRSVLQEKEKRQMQRTVTWLDWCNM